MLMRFIAPCAAVLGALAMTTPAAAAMSSSARP